MVYIGIDVGGTGIKIGLVNEEGQLIHQGETPTLVGRPYQEIIADMGHCALKVLEEARLTVDDVHSVGIADAKTGNVIFCTNMGWKDVPLRSELQKYINKPVFIDNDATVAGFAESVAGVSKGTSSSVFLTLGTGVGGGVIVRHMGGRMLPKGGARLKLEQIGRDMLRRKGGGSVAFGQQRRGRLPRQRQHQVDADVGKAGLACQMKGTHRPFGCVAAAEQAQHGIVKALDAEGKPVEAGGGQG